jgi:hypothetical protein
MATQSESPSEGLRARLSDLSLDQRSVITEFLVAAIQGRGTATAADLERALHIVEERAQWFNARLHGGPDDGEARRTPISSTETIEVIRLGRMLAADEPGVGHGESVVLPTVSAHQYHRRPGTPRPTPGSTADFDYTGETPLQS